MRTRRFAIAAGLVVVAGCNFDILNTNQPTLGDLLSNPTRDKLTAQANGLMSSARTGMESFIWRLGSMGREGINLSGNNQPDYAEPFFGPVQGGGSFGGFIFRRSRTTSVCRAPTSSPMRSGRRPAVSRIRTKPWRSFT